MRHTWFDHLRIPSRVLLLVAPALLASLCLTGMLLRQLSLDAGEQQRAARLAATSTGIGTLVQRLQREEAGAILALAAAPAPPASDTPEQRATTDRALAKFHRLSPADLAIPGSRLALVLSLTQSQLVRLPGIRLRVDEGAISAPNCLAYFGGTVAGLLDVLVEQGVELHTAAGERSSLALYYLMKAIEAAGQEAALGAFGFADGQFPRELRDRLGRLKEEQDRYFQLFTPYATDAERASLASALADPVNDALDPMRQIARDGGMSGYFRALDGQNWLRAASLRLDRLNEAEASIAEHAETAAEAAAQRAQEWFLAWLAGAALGVLALAAIATAIGRSLSRPLHRMTRTMTELAGGNLEVALVDHGRRDEIGAMARAVEVFRTNAVVRRQREAQIVHMARHDRLTGLPNRETFHEKLAYALTLVARGGIAAIMCAEIDGLKEVTEKWGHPAADRLICVVAERLQTYLRETDTVARLGGGEFAAVQIGLTRPDDAASLVRRLVDILGAPASLGVVMATPRVSVGVALSPLDGLDPVRLLRSAETALERARADGGNTYRFFEPEMERRRQSRQQVEADLVEALAGTGLELFYQPFADTRSGEVRGFEALVRLRHPTRGLISPGEFIPVAEETGLILPLGEWVLARACGDAVTWPVAVPVAVNLSAHQFRDPELVDKIAATLAVSGLPASRLELEITESVFLRDDERTLSVLHQIRALGIRVAMDDFGTGFSSLGYLRSFPFDKIKIDQSFVRELGLKDGSTAIVRAITMLGASFGMTVVAEGVETEQQLAHLREEGCALVQGYLFGRPGPTGEAVAMLGRATHSPARPLASALLAT